MIDTHSVDWASVRAEFPALEKWTFLNTATFGQLPRCTTRAVQQHLARRDETACADFLTWFDDADCFRNLVARLIHCSADDVAFITNAATALALIVSGIDWREGDRIVSLKDEFPNNLYFPAYLRRRGVEFVETPWESFYSSINKRTRLVLMSTANYSTGFRPPLAEVADCVHRHGGLLYADGTQSVGALEFRVPDIGVDMLAVHGYKWLLSPNGAGFMYVSPELRSVLEPNVVGWRSDRRWRDVNALHHGCPEFVESAEKYEGGMLNFPSIYGMAASVELMLSLGAARIERRVRELSATARAALESVGGEIAHPDSHILAAGFRGQDAGRLSEALKQHDILTAARHGRLRVSLHFYNNDADIDHLTAALRRLL